MVIATANVTLGLNPRCKAFRVLVKAAEYKHSPKQQNYRIHGNFSLFKKLTSSGILMSFYKYNLHAVIMTVSLEAEINAFYCYFQ